MSEHLDRAKRELEAVLLYEAMSPAESRLHRALRDVILHLEEQAAQIVEVYGPQHQRR